MHSWSPWGHVTFRSFFHSSVCTPTRSLSHSFVLSFVRLFVRSFFRSVCRSVVRSFLSSFVGSFVVSFRPFVRSFFRSLVRWFGPSFGWSVGQSFVRSFLCSVVSFILCIWLLNSLLNIVVVMMASIQVKICFFFLFSILHVGCNYSYFVLVIHPSIFFSIRVGFAQALGFLPKFMLSSRLKVVSTISFSSTTNHTGRKVHASKRNKRVLVCDSLRRLNVALFHRFQCFNFVCCKYVLLWASFEIMLGIVSSI